MTTAISSVTVLMNTRLSRIKWIGLYILACMLAMYGGVQGIIFFEKAGMLAMAVSADTKQK
jgi:hypothetical protein